MDLQNKPKQLIIIGGGSSIREGVAKDLWAKLKDKFVIGINYSFNYFKDPTILCYCDKKFYNDERKKLKKLSLVIGKSHGQLYPESNTILLKTKADKYRRDIRNGLWKSSLTGIFTLSLAIYLLNVGEIFLLGYDYSALGKNKRSEPLTHFYQDKIQHRGTGRTNYYDSKGRGDKDFGVYKNEKKIKIYNVSMKSRINAFEKISYDEFFSKLDKDTYNQKELRKYIKERLKK